MRRIPRACTIALCLLLAGCEGTAVPPSPKARMVSEVAWAVSGTWLKVDTHVHTEFSDGSHSIREVVAQAVRNGCDGIAITDHCDRLSPERIPDYVSAIDVARREFPSIVILTGVEWNVPPGGGDDHATVLFPPGIDEVEAISVFVSLFDDYGREQHDAQLALKALRWLGEIGSPQGPRPVVLWNHPSRKRDRSLELVGPMESWLKTNDVFVGFSGAPGHQAGELVGAYEGEAELIDRWDPAAARIGDVWDTLLRRYPVHAALAPSDFHSAQGTSVRDYWPGAFSEIWVQVPERTATGILQGLRAGTFFSAHGGICRDVQLLVTAEGLPRAAHVGEALEVPAGGTIEVSLECLVPNIDLQGSINWIDGVELIAVTTEGAAVVTEKSLVRSGRNRLWWGVVPRGGIVLRGRGYRMEPGGTKLMFYTNSVKVVAP